MYVQVQVHYSRIESHNNFSNKKKLFIHNDLLLFYIYLRVLVL